MGFFGNFLPLIWFRLVVLVALEAYLIMERMWIMVAFVVLFIGLTIGQIYTLTKNSRR